MIDPANPSEPGRHAVADSGDWFEQPDRRAPADRVEPRSNPQSIPHPGDPLDGPSDPDRAVPGRFAQLTYTSFDPDGGRGGGWRVHRTAGNPTAEEQQLLVSQVSTRPRAATSGYLTAAQVAALPRRLVHGPVPPGPATALWHTVPAGPDASGRPDNVFAHVLLDRAPAMPSPAVRPSDALASPEWLRPFGSEQILDTTLDTVPEPPWAAGPMAGYTAVAEFLVQEAPPRRSLLAVLVDAVAGALEPGGRPVVFAAETPERAERWIAALGRVMPAGAARRFFWSTWETHDELAGSDGPVAHLVVVGAADADGLAGDPRFVVVRDVEDQDVGGAAAEVGTLRTGEPHTTRDGVPVAVTPWSVLVVEVSCLRPETAARVLAHSDEIARLLGDPPDLGCAWPLAAAAFLRDDVLHDAQEEAAIVLAAVEPPGLANYPELRLRIRTMLDGTVGRTPQEALDYAAGPRSSSLVSPKRAYARYVELALLDWDWLIRREPLPKPREAHGYLSPELAQVACGALDRALARTADPQSRAGLAGVDAAVGVMRLFELIREYAIADATSNLEESLRQLVEQVVAPILLDPVRGLHVADRVGRLTEQTQRVVRAAVDRILPVGVRGPGDELVHGVHRWLHPTAPVPPAPGSLSASFRTLPRTTVELALHLSGIVPNPQAYLLIALWARFDSGTATAPELCGLAAAHQWTTTDLRDLAQSFDVSPVAPELRPWVLSLPWDDDLAQALRAIESRTVRTPNGLDDEQQRLLDAVRFRVTAQRWWAGPSVGGGATSVGRFLDAAERVLPLCGPENIAPEPRDALQGASLVDVVAGSGRSRPDVDRWMGTDALLTATPAVVAQVHEAIDHAVVSEEAFAFAAVVAMMRPTAPELASLSELAALTTADGSPVVERVLLERLATRDPDRPDLLQLAREIAEATFRSQLPPHRGVGHLLDDVEHEIDDIRRRLERSGAGTDTRPRRRAWLPRPF